MDIRNRRALKESAARALARGRDPKKLVFTYGGSLTLIAALLTFGNYWLSREISGTGGLGNFGIRSILATGQSLIPIIQTVLLLCLEFGYLYGMLRIARGQYADHTDLKMGFRKFGPILRLTMLQGMIFVGIGIAVFYFSMQIFLLTPWAEPLIELLMPIVEAGITTPDEATSNQAFSLMIPMFLMFALIYCVMAIPLSYRFRMANFALLDDPRAGALAALRASRLMMRKNCISLLRLDLSFWWYYLANVLATLIAYGDLLLPMVGISLPFNATVTTFLFYGLYLITQLLITCFLRNQVEATYIHAYDAIRPHREDTGIVLGSIFDT